MFLRVLGGGCHAGHGARDGWVEERVGQGFGDWEPSQIHCCCVAAEAEYWRSSAPIKFALFVFEAPSLCSSFFLFPQNPTFFFFFFQF